MKITTLFELVQYYKKNYGWEFDADPKYSQLFCLHAKLLVADGYVIV